MLSVVLIQARMNSSRLPAKVLLPVAGIPLVVLAVKRAENTGREVLVTTSMEPDDDVLCETLDNYCVKYHRDSLENTLKRMVNTVTDYDDETIVIRLTADNCFPDGHLIDEIVDEFMNRSLNYLSCNGSPCGLPYGMSVEVTKLKHLREANLLTIDQYDKEHVTPYIIRKFGCAYFERYKFLAKGHYRCTIDVFEDYINVCSIFGTDVDPINISWLSLVERLNGKKYQPLEKCPVPLLVFGSAQLGMDYGIANSLGKPSLSQSEDMLKLAISNGVEYVDTARTYGESEHVIGQSLRRGWSDRIKVITKLDPLDYPNNADYAFIKSKVDISVLESTAKLGKQVVNVLMLHRASHFQAWDGIVWSRLLELKNKGLIEFLGVSIQTPEELKIALAIESVDYIQMPFNLLDWRWSEFQYEISEVKKYRHLKIHIRSVFLQGLLLSEDPKLWLCAHVSEPDMIFRWIKQMVKVMGCYSPYDLCLRYARSMPWVDGLVVGMESREQLEKNIHSFTLPYLDHHQIHEIDNTRPWVNKKTLNPTKWVIN